jgi:hypothetical protein
MHHHIDWLKCGFSHPSDESLSWLLLGTSILHHTFDERPPVASYTVQLVCAVQELPLCVQLRLGSITAKPLMTY